MTSLIIHASINPRMALINLPTDLPTDLLMCCPEIPTEVLQIIQLRIRLMTDNDIIDILGYIITNGLIDFPIFDDSGWNTHGINLYYRQLDRLVQIQNAYLTDDRTTSYDMRLIQLITEHRECIKEEKNDIFEYMDKLTNTTTIHNLIQTQPISKGREYEEYIQQYNNQLRKFALSQNYIQIQNRSSKEVYVIASTKCLDEVIIKNHELIFRAPHNGVRSITKLAPRTGNLCETLIFNPRYPRCYVTIGLLDSRSDWCVYNRIIQKGKMGVITDTLLRIIE
jgi:hypothetical protein